MRGETQSARRRRRSGCHFNPLPSCEGRLNITPFGPMTKKFQSTPLTRGETIARAAGLDKDLISIHSPHARGDPFLERLGRGKAHFNPLPSCEGRLRRDERSALIPTFQSTPLMRGETLGSKLLIALVQFQSTPLMRGETLLLRIASKLRFISIHSPHARGDIHSCYHIKGFIRFQSTPLMRGETMRKCTAFAGFLFQSTPLMRGET